MLKRTVNTIICILLGHQVAWIKLQQCGSLPVLGCTRCHARLTCGNRSSSLRAER